MTFDARCLALPSITPEQTSCTAVRVRVTPLIHRACLYNNKSQSSLGRAASPSLKAENNYAATKSPLVTVGWPTFIHRTAPSPLTISTHLMHPFLDRPSP